MALLDVFKRKKGEERFEKKQREKVAEKKETINPAGRGEEKKDEKKKKDFVKSAVLAGPHVTEKSTMLNEQGVYVFKIGAKANKLMVKQAIKEAYGVRPKKICLNYAPSKSRFVRGKRGTKAGFKKAMVYLKKGDKIEI